MTELSMWPKRTKEDCRTKKVSLRSQVLFTFEGVFIPTNQKAGISIRDIRMKYPYVNTLFS
jgi:hypothetical protein